MKNQRLVLIILLVTFILIISVFYQLFNQEIESYENFELEVLAKNLDTPWAIDFFPNGKMVFTERYGRISVLNLETKEIKIVGEINVSERGESGLLGIAVDPEFEENNFVYVYYTYENGNRVSRFIFNEQNEKIESEFILLDNIPSARFHDGGRIKFGPDGKLYITTGDATKSSSAQDVNSLAGKILRMNKDGTIPKDNPFGNYVYSYGHRNPQGLVWNENGELFSSEHGPTRNDEINIIVKGENYGWPIECNVKSEFINPVRCFSDFTLAPSGIAFYKNDLYVAGLRGAQLRRIIFDDSYETILYEEELFSELGRIREVVEHNNSLYITTSNRDGRGIPKLDDDKIIKIIYSS
ncbi:MAG: PQQ-dependent sugar dehydrogenase [Nanoarchaeota archaeon]|nr:PQQ-dependent sugar dehydrogenase [Nanoarchaeota archaeon]